MFRRVVKEEPRCWIASDVQDERRWKAGIEMEITMCPCNPTPGNSLKAVEKATKAATETRLAAHIRAHIVGPDWAVVDSNGMVIIGY